MTFLFIHVNWYSNYTFAQSMTSQTCSLSLQFLRHSLIISILLWAWQNGTTTIVITKNPTKSLQGNHRRTIMQFNWTWNQVSLFIIEYCFRLLNADPFHSDCLPLHIACLVELKKQNGDYVLCHFYFRQFSFHSSFKQYLGLVFFICFQIYFI